MNNKENEQFITCPSCGEKIQLTQALTSHIETDLKKKYQEEYDNKVIVLEKKIKADTEKEITEKFETDLQDLKNQVSEKDKRLKDLNKRELELNQKERDLSEKEGSIQLKVDEQVKAKISAIEKKTKEVTEKIITEKYETDVTDLKNQVFEKDKKIKELNKHELELNRKERELAEKEGDITRQVTEQVNKKLADIEMKAKEDARKENSLIMTDLQSHVQELETKLSDAHDKEIELRKEKRELEADKKEFELIKQREIDAAKDEIYQKAKTESESDYRLKLRDKDLKLEQLTKTVDELNRKLEQGSQQTQGESQELELEDVLRSNFPLDEIIPVAKGVKGADVIQKVKNKFGFEWGTILWESKRHKRYDPKWIEKLKDDQRNEKANVAVLITQVLPDHISNFGLECGVFIGSFNSAIGIACALREQLFQIQLLRLSEVGKNQKMESLYNYLTSHEFTQRIEAILEAFESMQKQINDERKAYEKQWAAREKMLSQVLKNTAGMHGDLKGLIGASLPDIKALEMPAAAEKNIAPLPIDDDERLPF